MESPSAVPMRQPSMAFRSVLADWFSIGSESLVTSVRICIRVLRKRGCVDASVIADLIRACDTDGDTFTFVGDCLQEHVLTMPWNFFDEDASLASGTSCLE